MMAADDSADQGTKQAEIQRAVRQAEAAQKAMGSMPAGLQRLIDAVCEPQVRWQDHIERTIQTIYGSDEASWARVNRRRLAVAPHVPWPGRIGNRAGNVAIEIDTSGSIGDKELELFMGEVRGVLEGVMPEKIYAMYVGAKLFNDEVIELDDVSELTSLAQKAGGGGGTDMTVVFREIEERQLDVQCIIILTDGYTGFGEDCGIPTIWCITSPDITAPWGETVHVVLK
jgi:predicted metal-dependent peptidase